MSHESAPDVIDDVSPAEAYVDYDFEHAPDSADVATPVGAVALTGAQTEDDHESLKSDNMERLRSSFVENTVEAGLFNSPEEAMDALAEKTAEFLEHKPVLATNMSPMSFLRMMRQGEHGTFWDHMDAVQGDITALQGAASQNKKHIYDGYDQTRAVAEAGLREFAGEPEADHPSYAYLDTRIDGDVGDIYGNVTIHVDPERHAEATVYNFSDSFASVRQVDGDKQFDPSRVISPEDAAEAVAMMRIVNDFNARNGVMGGSLVSMKEGTKLAFIDGAAGYVEAAVFAPITPDDIEAVTVKLGSTTMGGEESYHALPLVIDQLEALGDGVDVMFNIRAQPNEIVQAWVQEHFSLGTGEGTEQAEQVISGLNIDPSLSYDEVSAQLRQHSQALVDQLRRSYTIDTKEAPETLSERSSFLLDLRQRSRNMRGETQELAKRLIQIEETRYFFQR